MSFFHKALEMVGGKRKINAPEPEKEFEQSKQRQQHKEPQVRVEKVAHAPQKSNYRPPNSDYRNKYNTNKNNMNKNNTNARHINQAASQQTFQAQSQRNSQVQDSKDIITKAPERIQHVVADENLKDPEIIMKELRDFRAKTSRNEKIKPYFVFDNQQLDELVEKNPRTKQELLSIHGFVPKKIEKYGDDIIRILNG